jgi:hypothetical protein
MTAVAAVAEQATTLDAALAGLNTAAKLVALHRGIGHDKRKAITQGMLPGFSLLSALKQVERAMPGTIDGLIQEATQAALRANQRNAVRGVGR